MLVLLFEVLPKWNLLPLTSGPTLCNFVERLLSWITFNNMRFTMEGVRIFLESSSISGLNHISTTKKCARAFWIVVVLAAIIMSCLLIYESFESWSKSPVRTTIQTLEMREIKFPKVTVCPPRNTFTDLNYDLMLGKNL